MVIGLGVLVIVLPATSLRGWSGVVLGFVVLTSVALGTARLIGKPHSRRLILNHEGLHLYNGGRRGRSVAWESVAGVEQHRSLLRARPIRTSRLRAG